jgi:GntR family transcriptional regulator, transcriptional repressor for pyruvate dehydrogenase complex
MPLTPVNRRSVPDEVFDQLFADIVSGELPPGAELPSERKLAEALGVSRPAVREALQRLAHARLIHVRQGDATTVRDYLEAAGPELLPRLLVRDGSPDLAVVRDVLEARLALVPDVARRCATRRSDDQAAALERLVDRMAGEADDLAALQRSALELWRTVVAGSGNVVYRLLFNALEATYLPTMALLTEALADELTALADYRRLVDAIVAREAATASAVARSIISRGTQAAFALLLEVAAPTAVDGD